MRIQYMSDLHLEFQAINLHHVMDFSATDTFDAVMENTGRIIHSYEEYLEEALRIKER